MTQFFTADPHLLHNSIIKLCNRPFKNTEHMWRLIKKNWNNTVTDNDEVWVAGDLTLETQEHKSLLKNMINSLNGTKHLILGNHDLMLPRDYQEIGFTSIHYPAVRLSEGLYVGHDPTLANAFEDGDTLVCGHQHGALFKSQWSNKGVFVIDVGVDVRNFTPISLKEVKQLFITGMEKQMTEEKTPMFAANTVLHAFLLARLKGYNNQSFNEIAEDVLNHDDFNNLNKKDVIKLANQLVIKTLR